ncbi:hypothetical protein LXL04_025738 [Taraxacum kok-saghyz]
MFSDSDIFSRSNSDIKDTAVEPIVFSLTGIAAPAPPASSTSDMFLWDYRGHKTAAPQAKHLSDKDKLKHQAADISTHFYYLTKRRQTLEYSGILSPPPFSSSRISHHYELSRSSTKLL